MKQRLISVILILGLLFFVPAITMAEGSPGAKASVEGSWCATGSWVFPSPPSNWGPFTWTITQSNTETGPQVNIVSSSGSTATGVISNDYIMFQFKDGCYPYYVGSVGNDTMSGYILCTRCICFGTWNTDTGACSTEGISKTDELSP